MALDGLRMVGEGSKRSGLTSDEMNSRDGRRHRLGPSLTIDGSEEPIVIHHSCVGIEILYRE